jgi:bacterioferritin
MNSFSTVRPAATQDASETRLELDQAALEAAKRSLEKGAITPSYGPWREDIIRLLNDALATEIVCTLRYKRHYFTAKGVVSPAIAEEFLVHANEETAHADLSPSGSCSWAASLTSIPPPSSRAAMPTTTSRPSCRP